jgi:hypothetical protein
MRPILGSSCSTDTNWATQFGVQEWLMNLRAKQGIDRQIHDSWSFTFSATIFKTTSSYKTIGNAGIFQWVRWSGVCCWRARRQVEPPQVSKRQLRGSWCPIVWLTSPRCREFVRLW